MAPAPRRRHRSRISQGIILSAVSITAMLLLINASTNSMPEVPTRDPTLLDLSRSGDFVAAEAPVDETGWERPAAWNHSSCATVEEMGESAVARGVGARRANLGVRDLIRRHFDLHGTARVRELPPHEFCLRSFVIAKASEAGFGNEMYKILTGAALSVILNRSLIIGQTRGLYPFGEYISYTNHSFTLGEIKHLWRKNKCAERYNRKLKMRVDNFENPSKTNVLCSDWSAWKQPIILFQGTLDAVGIQFFLKNVNPRMRKAASILFGDTNSFHSRPNVFGELLRVVISPSNFVSEAVDWVLKGSDPDVALHMRMLTNRSIRGLQAALQCLKKAIQFCCQESYRPRVVLVSDTPSFIAEILPFVSDFAEVLRFDYKLFQTSNLSGSISIHDKLMSFRAKDWGPTPRWVAFVDFFLASHARFAVISGAHRRVGTTYAQLIAALAAANALDNDLAAPDFLFFSSIQSNLLVNGLASQVGWGHVWNRFSGPLSCHNQPHQCAVTPLLPPAWWDGQYQSPISQDVKRLHTYGVKLLQTGAVDNDSVLAFCNSRKEHLKTFDVLSQ